MADITSDPSGFATREEVAAYDAWVRAKVERALASTTPRVPHAEVMARARAILDRYRAP